MERNDARPGTSIDVQALLAEVESLTRLAERSGSPATAGSDAPRRTGRPLPALAGVAAGRVTGPVEGEAAGEAPGEAAVEPAPDRASDAHPLDAASVSMAPGPIGRVPAEAPAIDDVGRTARAVQVAMPVSSSDPTPGEQVPAASPARAASGPPARRATGAGSGTSAAAGGRQRPDERPGRVRGSDPRPIQHEIPSAVPNAMPHLEPHLGARMPERGFAREIPSDSAFEAEPRRSLLSLVATLPLRLCALPIDLLPPAGRTFVSILAATMVLAAPVAWLLAWRTSTQSGIGPIPAVNLPGASTSSPKPTPGSSPADPGLSPASAPAR